MIVSFYVCLCRQPCSPYADQFRTPCTKSAAILAAGRLIARSDGAELVGCEGGSWRASWLDSGLDRTYLAEPAADESGRRRPAA